MFWLIFRIIIYLIIFTGLWYIGQFYVSYELNKGLHETSPYALFVSQKILENESYAMQQNGSFTYPFSTIIEALTTAREKNINTIIISDGTYKEILELPEDIVLYGINRVQIVQESKPFINVVTVNNNTRLINVDVSGGNNAVVIPHNTTVTFINTTLSNANDFGVKMERKKRPETSGDEIEPVIYEIFDKTEEEILSLPLVRFSNVTITKNNNQGMYLRDGRVEIVNSKIIENGEEGIDLHSHMHTTITNTESSRNGESGLETEIYDNIVTIKNSTFNNNTKNGLAFITSMGIGNITLANNTITNNNRFGIRCAVHKNKPKKPRPFFASVITQENNIIKDNIEDDISERCLTF